RHWRVSSRVRRRFDPALIEQLASKMSRFDGEPARELRFLRQCMGRLTEQEREMLSLRYDGSSVQAIAEQWGRPVGSISQTLYRIRGKLAECIKRGISAEAHDEA
ncbi:MAG: sigma factor-like helix-turn-helix DNA-binding protein, partial [Thermoguttaceae bacterium]